MTDRAIPLDRYRPRVSGAAAERRRLLAQVDTDEATLRRWQTALEQQLVAAPAATWPEAATKARNLLGLFASTAIGREPRPRRLIANVLEDFVRLARASSEAAPGPNTVLPDQPETARRNAMAKGQQKSNREKRKPKADKPKPPQAQASPFARTPGAAGRKPR